MKMTSTTNLVEQEIAFGYTPLANAFGTSVPIAEAYQAKPTKEEEEYFHLLRQNKIQFNPAQREAVRTTEGPLLLVAGAGSGKTTVLTSRIGYMIHTKNIAPKDILLVTFTAKASKDMLNRLKTIPGISSKQVEGVVTGTYHSLCFKILKAEGFQFEMLTSTKSKEIMIKSILREMNLQDQYTPEAILSAIATWKNHGLSYEDVNTHNDEVLNEVREVYRLFEEKKRKPNKQLFDFDDLILKTWKLFTSDRLVLAKYQKRFKYVLCDEFQDSSYCQVEILKLLAAPHDNIAVCGDESQTIYSFRSASPKYMLNFLKMYPNGKQIIMDINYRSVADVVGLGNQIVSHNKNKIDKQLKVVKQEKNTVQFARPLSKEDEADTVVNEIMRRYRNGEPLASMAVLFRTHAIGRSISEALLQANIPFVMGKKKNTFYDHALLTPVIHLLRAIEEPTKEDSIIKAAPILYVSKADMKNVIDEIRLSYYTNEPEPADLFFVALNILSNKFKANFQRTNFIRKINILKTLKQQPMSAVMELIRTGKGLGYDKQLEIDNRKTFTIHKEMVREVVDEFTSSVARFSSITQFLHFLSQIEEVNNQMDLMLQNPNMDAVHLVSSHSSKGLEYETVFCIGWSEGVLPHASAIADDEEIADSPLSIEAAIEEERRIAYVSCTRAIRNLYISSPLYNSRNQVQMPSRFLYEGLGLEPNIENINIQAKLAL